MVTSKDGSEGRPFKLPSWPFKDASAVVAKMSEVEIAQVVRDAEEHVRKNKDAKERLKEFVRSQQSSMQATRGMDKGESSIYHDQRRAKKLKARKDQAQLLQNLTQSSVSSPKHTAQIATSDNTEIQQSTPETSTAIPKPVTGLAASVKYAARPLPEWHVLISESSFMMKELSKKRPQALASLDALTNCLSRCEAAESSKLAHLFNELRDHVHKAEVVLAVDKPIIRKSRILTESGLPRIFKEDGNFPEDIKADAYQLYNRWMDENFDQDLLRGIVTVKGKDRNGDRLDKEYRTKHPRNAKFYGNGDIVLGAWWPTQLCAVRDGAHGAAQGGIYGEVGKGAYSIVVSSGARYEDEDQGATLYYSGTSSSTSAPTENTNHLLTSYRLATPIRVLRSSQLPKSNPYRPEIGLRYDGLYKVITYVCTNDATAMYKFRLERCEGQDEIRCLDSTSRRPTKYEVMEMEKLRKRGW